MHRVKRCRMAIRARASKSGGPGRGATSDLKMHGPEVMNLMLGTWAIKSEYAPSKEMPNGDTGKGLEEWRPGPGGYSLIEEFQEKNANGEISGFGPVWWGARRPPGRHT